MSSKLSSRLAGATLPSSAAAGAESSSSSGSGHSQGAGTGQGGRMITRCKRATRARFLLPDAPGDTSEHAKVTGVLSKIARKKRDSRKDRRSKQEAAKDAEAELLEELTSQSGLIRFPGSRHTPARWVRTTANTAAEELLLLLRTAWSLPEPSAVISVVGGTESEKVLFDGDLQAQAFFRRGLKRAATVTKAWTLTSGNREGVGVHVGAALQHSDLTVIGVLPW